MIRILLGVSAPVAKLEWSIYKGACGVHEDFTGANVFLWLIGAGNKFLVSCTTENGVIKATIPSMLPEGVYDLRAMWIKDGNCCKRSMSEVEKAFGVTYDPEKATPVACDCCTIRVKSCTASYGYDGLSAYEMSVLKGKTTMSEEEWLIWQNGIPSEVERILGQFFLQKFGNEEHKGISQKALTQAFNMIWDKIADITGEVFQGISMVVTPTYYFGDNGCSVHITANSLNAVGVFDHIAFYFNGELVAEAENVATFEHDAEITGTTEVMCRATILGIEYVQRKTVTHYASFFLGTGTSYLDIINAEHVIPITRGMRGAYDVNAETGDHIFVVVGENMRSRFIRADINGMEIPFTESTVTVDDNVYRVFTSVNTYNAGIYNIDING